MSVVAGSGIGESLVAQSRGVRFFALAGLILAVHLAALAVLLTTEYGPFAITLSVLAWIFVNCFLLVVLQRPGVCAALSLALIAILIALSHFKFGILQLTLTFLDFLIIDRDTFSHIDIGDGGRFARAGMGAVPGCQSYFQSGALGRGGGIAAGVDGMDRG